MFYELYFFLYIYSYFHKNFEKIRCHSLWLKSLTEYKSEHASLNLNNIIVYNLYLIYFCEINYKYKKSYLGSFIWSRSNILLESYFGILSNTLLLLYKVQKERMTFSRKIECSPEFNRNYKLYGVKNLDIDSLILHR